MRVLALTTLAIGLASAATYPKPKRINVQVGDRPYYLVEDMDEGPLKQKLKSCYEKDQRQSDFVIGHRGAPLQYPEHTKESYLAAIRQGVSYN